MTPKVESRIQELGDQLRDDGRTFVQYEEGAELAAELKVHPSVVLKALKLAGFELRREVPRKVRGFRTNNHDRWYGPGAESTHGGTGWEVISGFAGKEG
jgi:hypothetical protein